MEAQPGTMHHQHGHGTPQTPSTSAHSSASPSVDALCSSYARRLHGEEVDVCARGRHGRLWEIDPAWGYGTFWYFAVDDETAVAAFDVEFKQDASFSSLIPDFYCIESSCCFASQNLQADMAQTRRRLVGHACQSILHVKLPKPGLRKHAACIVMLPRSLQKLSLRCQCDPLTLANAVASLDGTIEVPGLEGVLDQIEQARPSAVVARAYYESKVTEATALVVDWGIANRSSDAARMRAADRSALNLVRRHLAEHLDRTVPTDELCAIACMSASKLSGLFKLSEGVTLQEYARMLRMQKACELLANTDAPLSTIAQRLGFARQSSFSEAFKRRYGLVPRDYRKIAEEVRADR